ncbi:hypothetical protein GCM10011401_27490 [Nesterenkonia cremea]|uniref:Uncharacterized protein n=1 Tax=Nesterenkonia cremea TaxID=1882340 RepID=A0A917AXR0_9MICC|nr:hypothetical protein GCM10011401_27490 [Nesterenkonia cremea]
MGRARAPVTGSGVTPAWICRVSNWADWMSKVGSVDEAIEIHSVKLALARRRHPPDLVVTRGTPPRSGGLPASKPGFRTGTLDLCVSLPAHCEKGKSSLRDV